jgi:CBS domain containing-hemolysin-like protein
LESVPIGSIAFALAAAALGSLFAAADAALTSLPEARLQALASEPNSVFARYEAHRVRILSRWLVARVSTISLAAAVLSAAAESSFGPRTGPFVALLGAVLTYGTLAEIMGTVARKRPEAVGATALRYLFPLEWAVIPLAAPLAMLGQLVARRFPEQRAVDARITETEVEWAVAEGEKTGALDEEPAEMIRNVLDFKHLTAKEVMVPRRKISAIELTTPLDAVIEFVASEKHSRYPVYRETPDNIVGLLYAKDLFDLVKKGAIGKKSAEEIMRKPVLFVTEPQSAVSVLREMRTRRLHIAVVSDDTGGTAGIVTLEDIIEEIVGEIRDEHDTDADAAIQKLADGRFVADASIPIGDLEAHLGRSLQTDGEFESLGGLIVQRAGRVPKPGEHLQVSGYRFIVRESDERRVVKVEIVRSEPELQPPAEVRA